MKQIRLLAQYYVDLMMKLGLVRFSMLLALALVVLAIVVQMAVTMVLHGQVESIDVIRSIFFGLLMRVIRRRSRLIKSPRATSGPVRMQKLTGWSIVSGISMMRSPKQQSWQK